MKKFGEISKKILKGLMTVGVVSFAATSPYFIINLLGKNKYQQKKIQIAKTFHYLNRRGLIKYRREGKQIYLSLTPRGKKYVKELQIDDLKIEKPRRWDRKWRILIFDISEKCRIVREVLRGKLKELGFIQLQKSVWIYPFDCENEFKILKTFFNLPDESFMFVVATRIPDEEKFKKIFDLS